jgi:polyribonucleotide nucleotidyltransferase
MKVKLIGTDPKSGKFKLSRKALIPKPDQQTPAESE